MDLALTYLARGPRPVGSRGFPLTISEPALRNSAYDSLASIVAEGRFGYKYSPWHKYPIH